MVVVVGVVVVGVEVVVEEEEVGVLDQVLQELGLEGWE